MKASELRELVGKLTWRSEQTFVPSDRRMFIAAAEVLELVAWAEERRAEIGRNYIRAKWGVGLSEGDTLLDTLRRAKEAAK